MSFAIGWHSLLKIPTNANANAKSKEVAASPKPLAHPPKPDAKLLPPPPPAWVQPPSPLRTMTEPVRQWIPGHAGRHDQRRALHQKIYMAVALSKKHDAGASAAWRDVVQVCAAQKISLASQLRRCSGEQPLLDQLLDARDFLALGELLKGLPNGFAQGRVHVIKRGIYSYIGEARDALRGSFRCLENHGYGYQVGDEGIFYGQFIAGRLSGPGSIRLFHGGARWEGACTDGSANGFNTATIDNYSARGTWINHKREGVFDITEKDGTREIATYKNGKLCICTLCQPMGRTTRATLTMPPGNLTDAAKSSQRRHDVRGPLPTVHAPWRWRPYVRLRGRVVRISLQRASRSGQPTWAWHTHQYRNRHAMAVLLSERHVEKPGTTKLAAASRTRERKRQLRPA